MACLVSAEVKQKLLGDPGRLRQILVNLVGNAIKFTEKGEIIIHAELMSNPERDVEIRFSVQDTGIGIPRERQEAIFERFSQVDSSTTRKYGGTGLGLTICKQLVEAMGGSIGVDSVEGLGSTFWFTVSFKKQFDADQEPTMGSVDLQNVHILIVDDNATNRMILTKSISAYGCRAAVAESGQEALEMVQAAHAAGDPYQVMLLDMQMPGMDGERTLTGLKRLPVGAEVRVVMLTSMGRRGDASRLESLGCSGYLVKPVKQHMLSEVVSMVLGQKPRRDGTGQLITRHAVEEFRGKGEKVLLAEDNPVNQKLAAILLQKAGYRVNVVENGREAVEQARKGSYFAVLMDVQMPEMDGFEATRRIRESETAGRQIPIIAMTAHALKGDRERCLEAGMDDYVSKPLQPQMLLSILGRFAHPKGKSGTKPLQPVDEMSYQVEPGEIVSSQLPIASDLFDGQGDDQQAFHSAGVPAGTGAPLDQSPMDLAVALPHFSNDRQFFDEMCQDFMEHMTGRLEQFGIALKVGDAKALSHHAHSLKGVSATFGANPLSSVCAELEMRAGKADLHDAQVLVDRIQTEAGRLLSYMKSDLSRKEHADD
jgi:CheY-like chemotaxis protein/HPt (histidine-containing phosphotransfer) domain-containing protein